MKFNKFVVQSFRGTSQFSDLEMAKKHASLNSPASIWRGEDVTEIQKCGCVTVKAHATPILHIWEKALTEH